MTIKELIIELETLQKEVEETRALLHPEEKQKEVEKLEKEMENSDFWKDQGKAKTVSQRHAHLKDELAAWQDLGEDVVDTLSIAQEYSESLRGGKADEAISSGDAALRQAQGLTEDIEKQTKELRKKFDSMAVAVLLSGEHDQRNAIVAIHAGAGGTEAQDWSQMIERMLLRYCERKKWKTEIIDRHEGGEAGIKSVVFEVRGASAYGYLKSENGVHRLVRISPFDAEKMRHTSFALVEVLPELDESAVIEIDEKDLKIDTYRSSGAGGQNVNKVETAVRITHEPSGIVVACQAGRSQARNRETAMNILRAKLHKLQQEEQHKEMEELRGEYTSAEWGNQIRSYVLHPYQMVKDHRTDVETSDTEAVLDGDLDEFVSGYLKFMKTQEH